jgi:hypothetical protein
MRNVFDRTTNFETSLGYDEDTLVLEPLGCASRFDGYEIIGHLAGDRDSQVDMEDVACHRMKLILLYDDVELLISYLDRKCKRLFVAHGTDKFASLECRVDILHPVGIDVSD